MGYTHQYTQLMIGLGVSSISDTWFAFAQNVKKVEEYLELINNGEIPVFKGHFLTEEDLLMRKHILNIMCKGETHWDQSDLSNDAFESALERLHELVADGLITREDYSLKVTTKGERFLRNICSAFDARLWAKEPNQQIFSMG
jgi:oxygen-independent coproporphyrinogen-3 oxidase